MKKILAIGLMLCVFTAMAVGTAAAKETNVKVTAAQLQASYASGRCATADSTQAIGVITYKNCDTKVLAVGAIQNGYASTACGQAIVANAQIACVTACNL
jgi:hypothetical protein